MLNQKIELIKVFLVVTETSSLQKAAQILNVTPSAISQSLKKFEQQIGVQLFLREHKKIILSKDGHSLKEKLSPLLGAIEGHINDFLLETKLTEPHGTISIGAPVELGSSVLVKCFSSFHHLYPQTKLNLRFSGPQQLMNLVKTGEVDFCLVADGAHVKIADPNLVMKPLFDEEFILVCSKNFYKKHKFKMNYEDLTKLPHLDYISHCYVVENWYNLHFKKKTPNLNVIMKGENAISLLEGVRNCLGLALLPVQRLGEELKNLHIVRPTDKKLYNKILLIQHQNKIPSLAEKKFIENIELNKKMFEQ